MDVDHNRPILANTRVSKRKILDQAKKESTIEILRDIQEGEVLAFLGHLRRRTGPRKRARPNLKGLPADVDVRESRRKRFEGLSGY